MVIIEESQLTGEHDCANFGKIEHFGRETLVVAAIVGSTSTEPIGVSLEQICLLDLAA